MKKLMAKEREVNVCAKTWVKNGQMQDYDFCCVTCVPFVLTLRLPILRLTNLCVTNVVKTLFPFIITLIC